nr:unnamed protein product [Callosobruchus chinensis]
MIQEEIHVTQPHQKEQPQGQPPPGHPQISVTDVLGSEVTLVAGSDTSEDSMDSLDNHKIPKIPSFIISEPSENLPSITRGIGRKTSQETEPRPPDGEEFFLRRNSDKSSCYSDDSLSNDSLSIGNQSPSSSSNTQSSHAFDADIRNSSKEVGNRLSLEYEGGIQIELRIVDKQKDSKGLKMRRISGDHLVYNQLCQQLISCMTVS